MKQWIKSYQYEFKLAEEFGYAVGVAFVVGVVGSIQAGGVSAFLDHPSADILLASSFGARAAVVAGRTFLARFNPSAIFGTGTKPPATPPTNATGL